jgi:hypothetical protein
MDDAAEQLWERKPVDSIWVLAATYSPRKKTHQRAFMSHARLITIVRIKDRSRLP